MNVIHDINKWIEKEMQMTFDINNLPKFTTRTGKIYCVRCGTYIGKLKLGRYIGEPSTHIRLLCETCRKATMNSILRQLQKDKNT